MRVAKATTPHHVEMLPLLFSSLVLHRTPPASLFSCSSFDALAALCSDILSLWHICIITLPPGSPKSFLGPFSSRSAAHVCDCMSCIWVHLKNDVDFVIEVAMNAWVLLRLLCRGPADAAVNKANNNACLHKNYAKLNNLQLFHPHPSPLIGQFGSILLTHRRPFQKLHFSGHIL